MKKILVCILSLAMALLLAACGNMAGTSSAGQKPATAERNTVPSAATDTPAQSTDANSSKKILVAYFSRTGDNYEVGNIEKGNTHIMAVNAKIKMSHLRAQ